MTDQLMKTGRQIVKSHLINEEIDHFAGDSGRRETPQGSKAWGYG